MTSGFSWLGNDNYSNVYCHSYDNFDGQRERLYFPPTNIVFFGSIQGPWKMLSKV